jgi:hypothetical protein
MGKSYSDLSDVAGEENVESMLLGEKGLRELAYLKVHILFLFPLPRSIFMQTFT